MKEEDYVFAGCTGLARAQRHAPIAANGGRVMANRESVAEREGRVMYSLEFAGDEGNYGWTVTADVHARGYIGIAQNEDRILLTMDQWNQIVQFVRNKYPM